MSQTATQDLDLLRLYSTHRDARAFAELVRRYADMVYATAQRVTGDAATAEDVSQDCFLALSQRSSSIRGSLPAWLHRTSLNRSLELQRAERSRRRREAQSGIDREDSAAGVIAKVDAALASLPNELRVLVTEHYLCGRTEADLAARAGVNQSTIHRKLDKALELLRRRLRNDDDDEPQTSVALAPMLLAIAREKAPDSLQQALVKIGLSGVGAATVSIASSARIVGWLAMLFIGFLTAGSLLYFTRPVATPSSAGQPLPIDQLPPAVQQVVRAQAAQSPLLEIEKKRLGDRIVFDVDFDADGKHHEMRVAEDGTLIWKKPP
jgi:RNA polymerase sigma-70 factor (ECF subfamily)